MDAVGRNDVKRRYAWLCARGDKHLLNDTEREEWRRLRAAMGRIAYIEKDKCRQ